MKNLSSISESQDIVNKKYVDELAESKVDKVNGKGLSTNDFTDEEKQKLADLSQSAYTLPVASQDAIGGVKSGTDITVDNEGNVSINDDSHNHKISNISDLNMEVLTKTNTAEYVPTNDYNPATKKYVDDNIGSPAYDNISNKPTLNGIIIEGNKSSEDYSVAGAEHKHEVSDITGLTTTIEELNYVDGVTGNIQTQLDNKAPVAHNHTVNQITDLSKSSIGLENVENKSSETIRSEITSSNVTTALGYTPAELDTNGKVPTSQLPSYVDDVLEYAAKANFPTAGETGKIYVDLTTNLTYRWSGSAYTEISPSIALGETSSTAYRGDRGKTAYDHSQVTSGNPHKVTKSDVGLGSVENKSSATIRGEITSSNVTTALGYTPLKTVSGVESVNYSLQNTTAGWYRIANIPYPTGSYLFQIHKGYNNSRFSTVQFAISINGSQTPKVGITQIQAALYSGWFSKVRVVYDDSKSTSDFYVEIYAGTGTSEQVFIKAIHSTSYNILLNTTTAGSIPDGCTSKEFEFTSNSLKAENIVGNIDASNIISGVLNAEQIPNNYSYLQPSIKIPTSTDAEQYYKLFTITPVSNGYKDFYYAFEAVGRGKTLTKFYMTVATENNNYLKTAVVDYEGSSTIASNLRVFYFEDTTNTTSRIEVWAKITSWNVLSFYPKTAYNIGNQVKLTWNMTKGTAFPADFTTNVTIGKRAWTGNAATATTATNATNSDKVKINRSSSNGYYPALLTNQGDGTTVKQDSVFATSNNTVTINPSTGSVKATKFEGSLTGNVNGKSSSTDSVNCIAIAENTDLNTVTTPGFYRCSKTATASTLTNCPVSSAFFMIVGTSAYNYQELVTYEANSPKRYMRNKSDSGWGAWKKIYTEADKPTLSDLGVTATAAELNYVDGVTSAIQTQLNAKAATSAVLTKTNTTSFTPTANYHPATKKYVDDKVASAGGSSADIAELERQIKLSKRTGLETYMEW